jgi:hypothetical protein
LSAGRAGICRIWRKAEQLPCRIAYETTEVIR